jgi:hypothetical protein
MRRIKEHDIHSEICLQYVYKIVSHEFNRNDRFLSCFQVDVL